MVTLKEKNSNAWLGSISYAQLQFLINELPEQHKNADEYLVHRETLARLKQQGAEVALTNVLEKAIGDKDQVEFYWIKS